MLRRQNTEWLVSFFLSGPLALVWGISPLGVQCATVPHWISFTKMVLINQVEEEAAPALFLHTAAIIMPRFTNSFVI